MVNPGNFRPRACQVIPEGWEQHHRPTVNATLTAVVQLWSGPAQGEKEWIVDPDNPGMEIQNHGIRLFSSQIITARIQGLLSEDTDVAAGQKVSTRRHLVVIDRELAAGITTRARVLVSESTDPILTGKFLQVQDILTGSLRWERDLICLENI